MAAINHYIDRHTLKKIDIHTRFSARYKIPIKVLIQVLVELDTNWGLGYSRFQGMSEKLKRNGIEITNRQLRYIYNVYKNLAELNFKLKGGGKMFATLKKMLYGNT